ncbi:MAG TPA: hypothetical protein VFA41_12675 [Ktedonobacteraceae bacterium]|jgi:aminoglycoside phosphotransferase family enzyme|nr:hypothetical protein [Ktedonobacteraceae bacterium]
MFDICSANMDAVKVQERTTGPLALSGRQEHYYFIEKQFHSESAWIVFAHNFSNEPYVLKILRDYRDTRYDLSTPDKRRQCQLEALQKNRMFTPDSYKGLALVCDWKDGQYILTGDILENPTHEILESGLNAEYALIMKRLPDEQRLDNLLNQYGMTLYDDLCMLTSYLAEVHERLELPDDIPENPYWGSPRQLEDKLWHNLELLHLILASDQYSYLQESILRLHSGLLEVFSQCRSAAFFEQRLREKAIRNCHGDIKALNLWILPPDEGNFPCDRVKLLDAIDFNPTYCNIDTLSDFAMLAVDIETRTNPWLADSLVDYYLELTNQDNEAARTVLAYYRIEKAIVGAAISIVYDNLPELGLRLLNVAQRHLALQLRQPLLQAA